MPYPNSSDVLPGDATAASQYNNLRGDAIFLGQAAADSVNLAQLLNQYQSNLKLRRHQTTLTKVYVVAGARIMIDGYLCYNPSAVNLPDDQVPTTGAANYYVFAKRAAGSTTFTLVTKAGFVPDANERLIGQFYWTGALVEKDSVRTVSANEIAEWLYFVEPHVFGGRLSSTNTTPVNPADVTGAANIYYVPFSGNRVSLYVPGYGWRVYPFSVLTLNLNGATSGMPHDIFLRNNAGTLQLSFLMWNTPTTRATGLTFQDGIRVLDGSPEYLYLGTFLASAANQFTDSVTRRLLWNQFNKVPRYFYAHDDTDSWTYNSATWRKWNGADTTKLDCVIGLQESFVHLQASALMESSNNTQIGCGIAINADNTNHAQVLRGMMTLAATYNKQNYGAEYFGYLPNIGYNFMHATERSSATGTITVYGDHGQSVIKSAIYGYILA